MGPSGSGKTTLLNVLAQRNQTPGAKLEGDTLINGSNVAIGDFRRLTSFVEQEEFVPFLVNILSDHSIIG